MRLLAQFYRHDINISIGVIENLNRLRRMWLNAVERGRTRSNEGAFNYPFEYQYLNLKQAPKNIKLWYFQGKLHFHQNLHIKYQSCF